MTGTTPAPDLVVRTRGLTKRFDRQGRPAVEDMDLEVRRGEVFGLLGPNGAGKSTTLRLLLDLLRPSQGEIEVLGEPAGSCRHRIGAIVEEPAFYPYLTGRQNLRMAADLAGAGDADLDESLRTVGLAEAADRAVDGYSTGMRQRLGIAAALVNDPDLLVLDEPSAGLDPEGVREVRDLLRRLGRGERTILVSSHLLTEVNRICDRVGVLRSGHLVYQGGLDELRRRRGPCLTVSAEPRRRAAEVLADLGLDVDRGGGDLVVEAPRDRAPEVTRALVEAGLEVYEVAERVPSLEDAYLEVTR